MNGHVAVHDPFDYPRKALGVGYGYGCWTGGYFGGEWGMEQPVGLSSRRSCRGLAQPGLIRWAVNSSKGGYPRRYMQAYADIILVLLGGLVAVAWSTLLERKFLGGFQWRKGPNKMGGKGFMQPLGDAAKLLLKGRAAPLGRGILFLAAPVFSLFITLLMWSLWQFPGRWRWLAFGGAFFLCLSSVHILGVLGSGWSRNRTYALWGAARGVALVLSYEIAFVTILLGVWRLRRCVSMETISLCGALSVGAAAGALLALSLAETQRAPFDFIEAERELVSGFNVEYRAGGFVLLFLSEYGAMLFLGQFLAGVLVPVGPLVVMVVGLAISAGFLGARAAYPRLKVSA